jgi:hypothetical protein
MRHRRRPLSLLIIGILSLATLVSLIYFFPPNTNIALPTQNNNLPFSLNQWLEIPPMILFFLLIAIFLFSTGSYIFKSRTHGVLIAGLVVIYLLFRLYHLTHPFFLILLLALFFSLEMFVSSRGNSK